MTSGGATVATTATEILPANRNRQRAEICNLDAAANMHVGDSSVSMTTGIQLAPGGTHKIERDAFDGRIYRGAVYGIVAANTSPAGYWEES